MKHPVFNPRPGPDEHTNQPGRPALASVTTEQKSYPVALDRQQDSGAHPPPTEPDLYSPPLYLNREITWLEFNKRVLHEAQNPRNPALERLKYFAIFASNLDEFFMKRVGGLKLQVATGVRELSLDGRSPQEQIDEICSTVRQVEHQRNQQLPQLLNALRQHGLCVFSHSELNDAQRAAVRRHFLENIFPLVTPQVVDPAHPFPFISNLSLNILVSLKPESAGETVSARIKVPVGIGIPRFIRIDEKHHYVPLEEVMLNNLDTLFPGVEIMSSDLFFVARNAAAERDQSGANDLMSMIELELRDRRIAPIVRILVNRGIDQDRKAMLAAELGLDVNQDVFQSDGFMGQRDFMQLAELPISDLHYPAHAPLNHYRLQDQQRSIFYILREAESILLQHPYESFATSVVRLLEESARDPKVRAIKMTLYRTDRETRIIDLLIDAAHNGKQVAVVVELKAKFDEAANIELAERMEQAGIHVTYGVIGLKTHCKVLMAVRQDYNGLRRYVHIGTGNYHGGTARLYADMGLLTSDQDIGHDVTELFNYLTTGCTPKRNYRKLILAPKQLKKAVIAKIEREIKKHTDDNPGLIQIKTNALEDGDIVRTLYRASLVGVKVELIVRDTCRLRPGVPGLSDNISVISIVGRFLEHSRIFYFKNGDNEEYLIGSADLMSRNLEKRVEMMVKITPQPIKDELRLVLDAMLGDECEAWDMQPDGSYIKRRPTSPQSDSSQQQQIRFAQTRLKSKRHKKLLRNSNQHKRNFITPLNH